MGVIFTKTHRGREEIVSRSGDLLPRSRRVLILIDGKRNVDDLQHLVQADNLRTLLGQLEEDGYIEMLEAETAAAAASPLPGSSTPSTIPLDAKRLRQAKQLMADTIRSFIGSSGLESFLRRVDNAGSREDILGLQEEWFLILSSALESSWEARDQRERLLKMISTPSR